MIFAELKSEKGKLTDEQKKWIDAFVTCAGRVETYLWRSEDLDDVSIILSPRYGQKAPTDDALAEGRWELPAGVFSNTPEVSDG